MRQNHNRRRSLRTRRSSSIALSTSADGNRAFAPAACAYDRAYSPATGPGGTPPPGCPGYAMREAYAALPRNASALSRASSDDRARSRGVR